jgi:glycosyltransferase A (GT-A) superfamily protein (DUF2064 family)
MNARHGARAALLVLAKAPVSGKVKTRLCPPLTSLDAACIAAAALLDTLETIRSVPHTAALVAMTGSLRSAERRVELAIALAGTLRYPQRGDTLGARIAAAHADAAARLPGRPVLQIGMDTPQLRAADLAEALTPLTARRGPDAVFGPALDGGWWALGLRDPRAAAAVAAVPTSQPDTGERTLRALRDAGLRVEILGERRDVDTAADLLPVAAEAPASRFSAVALSAISGFAAEVGAASR